MASALPTLGISLLVFAQSIRKPTKYSVHRRQMYLALGMKMVLIAFKGHLLES